MVQPSDNYASTVDRTPPSAARRLIFNDDTGNSHGGTNGRQRRQMSLTAEPQQRPEWRGRKSPPFSHQPSGHAWRRSACTRNPQRPLHCTEAATPLGDTTRGLWDGPNFSTVDAPLSTQWLRHGPRPMAGSHKPPQHTPPYRAGVKRKALGRLLGELVGLLYHQP